MPCCFAAGGDAAATEAIVTTLQSFARNVCKAPHEAKYRRINLSNAGFNAKVWQYESARTFFLAWGWQVVDGFLVLPADVDSTVALATISRRLQWVPNLSTYPHPNAPIMHLSPHPFIHPAQNASELAPRFLIGSTLPPIVPTNRFACVSSSSLLPIPSFPIVHLHPLKLLLFYPPLPASTGN